MNTLSQLIPFVGLHVVSAYKIGHAASNTDHTLGLPDCRVPWGSEPGPHSVAGGRLHRPHPTAAALHLHLHPQPQRCCRVRSIHEGEGQSTMGVGEYFVKGFFFLLGFCSLGVFHLSFCSLDFFLSSGLLFFSCFFPLSSGLSFFFFSFFFCLFWAFILWVFPFVLGFCSLFFLPFLLGFCSLGPPSPPPPPPFFWAFVLWGCFFPFFLAFVLWVFPFLLGFCSLDFSKSFWAFLLCFFFFSSVFFKFYFLLSVVCITGEKQEEATSVSSFSFHCLVSQTENIQLSSGRTFHHVLSMAWQASLTSTSAGRSATVASPVWNDGGFLLPVTRVVVEHLVSLEGHVRAKNS